MAMVRNGFGFWCSTTIRRFRCPIIAPNILTNNHFAARQHFIFISVIATQHTHGRRGFLAVQWNQGMKAYGFYMFPFSWKMVRSWKVKLLLMRVIIFSLCISLLYEQPSEATVHAKGKKSKLVRQLPKNSSSKFHFPFQTVFSVQSVANYLS